MTIYGYPDMGRTGLGHSLLAWGRCVLWCERSGATMLAPRWLRLRIGPYLRGERDKRAYYKLFQAGNAKGEPIRSVVLTVGKKYRSNGGYFKDDITSDSFLESLNNTSGISVVVFDNAGSDNDEKHFHHLLGHSELLRSRFMEMTKKKLIPANVDKSRIAIHVRLGDFAIPDAHNLELRPRTVRIPISWYCAALAQVRKVIGQDIPATVYSDGTDEELAELLAVEGVVRASSNEAVTDMLSMAEAPLLIASGSGFSLWSCYFGQVPSISFPGRKLPRYSENDNLSTEWQAGDSIDDAFMLEVQRRVSNAASRTPS